MNNLQQLQAEARETTEKDILQCACFRDEHAHEVVQELVKKAYLLGLTVAKDCIPEEKKSKYFKEFDKDTFPAQYSWNECRIQTETAITREIDKVQEHGTI